ncbi:MAG: hypothetical protein M1453_11305 [Acidobacteria bacterium]|nr:hypothetical protein [Acidobacteriota bacterium]MCL5288563.1 hypothetical protein [Acidobacteriota bacterium]
MMKLWIALFVAIVLALFLPCATGAQETFTGNWQLQPHRDPEKIQLRVEYGTWGHHSD